MNHIYPLLLVVALVASCQAQDKGPAAQLKMIKPAGVDPYTSIRCGLEDKAGNLWFGTTGAGIYRYDGRAFVNFTEKEGLSNNIVYCMAEDNAGNIWIGTDRGVCRYDGKTFNYITLPGMDDLNASRFNGVTTVNNPQISSHNAKQVFSMIKDKKGNLWLGTAVLGLYRYDGSSFTRFKYKEDVWGMLSEDSAKVSSANYKNAIQCLLEDKAGNIWFSAISHGGAYRYDGKTFTHLAPEGMNKSHVFYMLEDKGGSIWFGTRNDGIYRYDGSSFTAYTEKEGLCSNNTTSILEDKKGNIWFSSTFKEIAGRTKGCVTRYDGKSFTRLPVDGLANSSVWNMLEDKSGNIWIGSRNVGLYRYDGKTFAGYSAERPAQ